MRTSDSSEAEPGYRVVPILALLLVCLILPGCSRPSAPGTTVPKSQQRQEASEPRRIRATGLVQALRVHGIQTPQITGQNGRITLTKLVPNGAKVNEGDVLAEFDTTQQLDNLREAEAKYDDFSHQVEQKRTQYRSDAAKRIQTLREAEADLAKAELQLRKAELLAEIDRLKNETRASGARARVASLKKSNAQHDEAEAAAVKIAELQRDRQKVSVERTQRNLDRLRVKAPIAGMVALETTWRNGSMGPPQEGDQLWPGQSLVRIFDPAQMVVQATVAEPDGAAIAPGSRARIRVDAYPETLFDGVFESASPVATSALDSPIKTFSAVFRITQMDPRLLPDLSVSVEVDRTDNVLTSDTGRQRAAIPGQERHGE